MAVPPGNRFIADRILKDKLSFLRIYKQNQARFGAHLFQRNIMKWRFDELVQIDRLKQGLAHPLDRF
jgi:hypothetical protein